MEKVVVIGASGFLGSHVADELSRSGCAVTLFDRRPSPWLRTDQEMAVGDMLDRRELARALEGAAALYHFGGVADIGAAAERPYDAIEQNVMGATVALEAALEAQVGRFMYASTMYVYSSAGSLYRASKQAAETVIEAYCERFPVAYTFLRYGSLYGPRAQAWNGLRRFVSQVVREGRLDYPGDGRERREYIHVRDAARLSVEVLDDAYRNSAITVTGSQVLHSAELLDMIFEIAGRPRNVRFTGGQTEGARYVMTPYRYTPREAKKLAPKEFVDIGQGILDLVEEIHGEMERE